MTLSLVTTPPDDADDPRPHPDSEPPGTLLGPHYSECYGCGDEHPTGLHLKVRAGEGVSITAEFTVTEMHQGAPGLAHGGLLSAAFDDAIGYILWILRRPAVTGRLETDFLRPVPVGCTLFIEAACIGVQGRKIWAQATGRLGGPDGEVAVRAAALFIEVGVAHFMDHGRGFPEGSYNP